MTQIDQKWLTFLSERIAHYSILKAVKTFTRTKPNLQGIAMHAKQVIWSDPNVDVEDYKHFLNIELHSFWVLDNVLTLFLMKAVMFWNFKEDFSFSSGKPKFWNSLALSDHGPPTHRQISREIAAIHPEWKHDQKENGLRRRPQAHIVKLTQVSSQSKNKRDEKLLWHIWNDDITLGRDLRKENLYNTTKFSFLLKTAYFDSNPGFLNSQSKFPIRSSTPTEV